MFLSPSYVAVFTPIQMWIVKPVSLVWSRGAGQVWIPVPTKLVQLGGQVVWSATCTCRLFMVKLLIFVRCPALCFYSTWSLALHGDGLISPQPQGHEMSQNEMLPVFRCAQKDLYPGSQRKAMALSSLKRSMCQLVTPKGGRMQGVAPCKMDLSGFGIFISCPSWSSDMKFRIMVICKSLRNVVLFISIKWHPLPNPQAATLFQVILHHFTSGLYFSPDGYLQFGWWGCTCRRLLL